MNKTEARATCGTLPLVTRIAADNNPKRADRGDPELRSCQRHFLQSWPESAENAVERRHDESREHDRDRHGDTKVVGEAAHQHTAGPIITNVQGSEASARATPNSACSGGGATM